MTCHTSDIYLTHLVTFTFTWISPALISFRALCDLVQPFCYNLFLDFSQSGQVHRLPPKVFSLQEGILLVPCDKISTFFEVLAGIKLVDFAFGLKLLELFSQTCSKAIYFGSFAHSCSPQAKSNGNPMEMAFCQYYRLGLG